MHTEDQLRRDYMVELEKPSSAQDGSVGFEYGRLLVMSTEP
jgi:hypothetical protein